jgi:hypothetical protein
MDFTKFTFIERYKNNKELYFDFNIREFAKHNRNTFDDYKSLLYFLDNNNEKKLYITIIQTDDFFEQDNNLVINLNRYQEFCKKIGQNGINRAQAFFARKLRHYSDEEKKAIIAGSSEADILKRIKQFSPEQKKTFLNHLHKVDGFELPKEIQDTISPENLIKAFEILLGDNSKLEYLIANYPKVQIEILEAHKKFLECNFDKDETFIQNWIDGKIDNKGRNLSLTPEEIKRLKKSRCLIFGLEFIDHKREGQVSSKRFDVLTRISEGRNEYVLIELKSPRSDFFKIVETKNDNNGRSTEYHLSDDTARSVPQISDYRNYLENANDIEWEKIGLPEGKVSKCLILIGTRKLGDPVWEDHYSNLRKTLSNSIEIMTYTDLVQKLDTTIKNLKENL